MTTLRDIQTRDITADEIKAMVVAYDAIRKNRDVQIADLDNETVYDKFWYYIHSIARLTIDGVDPDTTTLALARRLLTENDHKAYTTEIALTDADGNELMKFVWNGKHAIVTNSDGNVLAEGEWRADVRPMFKSAKAAVREAKAAAKKAEKTAKKATASKKEKVLKKAAAPKKTRKTKKAKTAAEVEAAVTAQPVEDPAEPAIVDEINEMLDDGMTLPV